MTVTSTAPAPSPPPRRRRGAQAAGVLGEVLITLGVVLALFVSYELWWTGQQTAQAQDRLTERLDRVLAERTPSAARPTSPSEPVAPTEEGVGEPAQPVAEGEGMARLRIPRLGDSWEWVVVEGVDRDDLKTGPGHYPGTALPGEVGNFAVAGHRRTYGQPFVDLDRLQPGDRVFVEGTTGWATYEVDSSEVVLPGASDVVLPVPKQPGAKPTEALLTLTTCYPKNSSEKRLIVYGSLVEQRTPEQGPPPEWAEGA